jgi:hypothetical protein
MTTIPFVDLSALLRRISTISTTFVVIAALPLFSQTIPAERWQKYSSPGGFSVLLPGEPHESTHGPSGSPICQEAVKSYAVDVGLDQGYFSIVSCVYLQPIASANDSSATLDRLQAIAARGARGKIASQKDLTIEGMPARRISIAFQINGTSQTMDEMPVVVRKHLFHLVAASGQSQLGPQDLSQFFDSFSILGESTRIPEKPREPATQNTPGVTYFECPAYPIEAKAMRIQGQVYMRVTTDGKKVIDLKTSGHPKLVQAAEQNIKTWRFSEDAPKEFSIRYSYVNEGEYEPDPVTKCDAKMNLPTKVQVSF